MNEDYLHILNALKELPFPVGKSTLADLLVGAVNKKMVSNSTYMDLKSYGILEQYQKKQILQWIDRLEHAGFIQVKPHEKNAFWKLLQITKKGIDERKNPTFLQKQVRPSYDVDTLDTDTKKLISQFSFYFEGLNTEQQHAIATPSEKVLCVAGAGSGKTTVLTKRIQFLTQFRGIKPNSILAITFTRKAREEMQKRLEGSAVMICTFNSFCQKILSQAGLDKPIITYGQKMQLFSRALRAKGLQIEALLYEYYTRQQRYNASNEELSRRLAGDVFSIIDHYANEAEPVPLTGSSSLATTLLQLALYIQQSMDKMGVRDYSGQLSQALVYLQNNPQQVPKYQHILVDEYQDVNKAQKLLLDILAPANIFVVGDPRQSIFGWRGSQVQYILDFPADITIQLQKNYRSCTNIISVMNKVIRRMKLPDISASTTEEGVFQVMSFDSEEKERVGVTQLLANITHEDVFVLARTNRQLQDLSDLLSKQDIAHSIRHEEDSQEKTGIVLSTVHAIKGLEARSVIVFGCSSRYFPCKVSDHPVIDLIKDSDLDREEEELRLLYVAVSRAKKELIITHSGNATYFFDAVLGMQKKIPQARDDGLYEQLRAWRSTIAKEKGLPAYCIVSDKTLREVSTMKPQHLSDLEDVHGLGEKKIEQYGEDLLSLLR